jgi:phosphoribosylformylglycinamidine synthase
VSQGVRAIVITGFGLNCEAETAHALTLVGAGVEQVHLNDLIVDPAALERCHILVLIGGFSFGDHIGAATVFANRLKYRLREPIERFVASGRLILGICNGFQTLVKFGLLPGLDGDLVSRRVTLTANDNGLFRNDWVHLRTDHASPCIFTRGIETIDLPIRHGEGKFVPESDDLLDRLREQHLVPLRYADPATGKPTGAFPHNPNGSVDNVAGICNPTGRVFGMMPHPEGSWSPLLHPDWPRRRLNGDLPERGDGLRVFENAVAFAGKEL